MTAVSAEKKESVTQVFLINEDFEIVHRSIDYWKTYAIKTQKGFWLACVVKANNQISSVMLFELKKECGNGISQYKWCSMPLAMTGKEEFLKKVTLQLSHIK